MAMNQAELRDLIRGQMWDAFKVERERLNRIDRWYRFDHDKPHSPRQSTKEYRELGNRAQTPWLGLVVATVAQELYVEGYRRADDDTNADAWDVWQANGMDRRQIAVHRAALAYGTSYVTVLPGETMAGDPMPAMRGVSPRRMIAFYRDEEDDEWPLYGLRATPARVNGQKGWRLRLYDDELVYFLQCGHDGDEMTYIEYREHGAGVPGAPIVRFANMLDLEERADGEVEPFISIAGRIDQTTFDRLVVQRFASWVVRTISGMSPPDHLTGESEEQYRERTKVALTAADILIADDADTKFGSLPSTPLDGFIAAHEADVKSLAAVTQTPPHHLLGQMANLSAEALAAAEASKSRKIEERKHSFGESWEQALRLADGAADYNAQVRWRDTESRSLAQTADALGKLATMLGVPVEALWERIPGVTQQDLARWKRLADEGGAMEQMMRQLAGATEPPVE
jgi:hypothetical protein